MKSLDPQFLEQQAIPIEMGGMLQLLGEFKGRQELFRHQAPQVLESFSRDMIRVVLNRLRREERISCRGTGRKALWEKRGNNKPKRGNKRGNNSDSTEYDHS